MSKSRSCGPRCHNAKSPPCACWCGGLFHGAEGKSAREAFVLEYGGDEVPAHEDEGSLFWDRAIAAAREARARDELGALERANALNAKGSSLS